MGAGGDGGAARDAGAGGEWGGGVLLISEAVGRRRGYFSSFSQLGVAGGFVLSSGVFMLAQQCRRSSS